MDNLQVVVKGSNKEAHMRGLVQRNRLGGEEASNTPSKAPEKAVRTLSKFCVKKQNGKIINIIRIEKNI